MTCQEVIDFLSDYVDGTLPWRQRALFLVHLGLCRDCRNYVASFHLTMQLLRATAQNVDADQLPPFPPELMQAIEAIRK
jgi:predicted anti-sigma-YlaC factor YlaD